MKVLGHAVGDVYIWAIALLAALAAVSAYTLRQAPWALVAAVVASVVAEVLVSRFHHKHRFRIPFSGIITGLIIGSVAPINAPVALAVLASLVAVLSKHFFKFRRVNVFNPAAIGLVVALALFSLGDEWWAAGSYSVYGMAVALSPVLLIAAYRARRLTASFAFILCSAAIAFVAGQNYLTSGAGVATVLFGINYYMAFIMVADPKTSPHGRMAQAAFGAGLAVVLAALSVIGAPYPALLALLAGNVAFAAYRARPSNAASAAAPVHGREAGAPVAT